MRNLIEFLQRYLYWLVFLTLEAISLVSLFQYNSYQGSVALSTANSVVGSVLDIESSVTSYFSLKDENTALEAENERLRRQILQMSSQNAGKAEIPDSIGSTNGTDSLYHYVAAKVVGLTLHRTNNLMTIDRGTADGLRPEMAVVSSTGIVGIVYLCSAHYSIVIPLLNESSQISCRLRGSDYFGTMQWTRGEITVSYVSGIPRHAKVKPGDTVETNGFSDIFPEGIPVGRVSKISDSTDGMSYRLTVRLSTDFSTLRNVSVITDYSHAERRELESLREESL